MESENIDFLFQFSVIKIFNNQRDYSALDCCRNDYDNWFFMLKTISRLCSFLIYLRKGTSLMKPRGVKPYRRPNNSFRGQELSCYAYYYYYY